jgi:hypothetical protein
MQLRIESDLNLATDCQEMFPPNSVCVPYSKTKVDFWAAQPSFLLNMNSLKALYEVCVLSIEYFG